MLDQAFAVGRTGNPVERVVEEARTLVNKVNVAPRVAIDQAVLAATLATLAAKIDRLPTSASVAAGTDGYDETSAVWGREVDQAAMTATIIEALAKPDAPSSLSVPTRRHPDRPGRDRHRRDDREVARQPDGRADHAQPRQGQMDDRRHDRPRLDLLRDLARWHVRPAGRSDEDRGAVKALSKKVDQKAIDATFYTSKGGSVVGVKPRRPAGSSMSRARSRRSRACSWRAPDRARTRRPRSFRPSP